jgi:hypothetical protein
MILNKRLTLMLGVLLAALAFTACTGPQPAVTTIGADLSTKTPDVTETIPASAAETEAETKPAAGADAFAFVSGGTTIRPTGETREIEAFLSEARETGEAPSCAFEGLDKVYRYDGFEIQTGMLNGVDYVTGVIILDENVKTPEGLSIGMSLEEMVEIYGDDYAEDFGQYVYEDEDVRLIMIIDEGEVLTISYIGKFE